MRSENISNSQTGTSSTTARHSGTSGSAPGLLQSKECEQPGTLC